MLHRVIEPFNHGRFTESGTTINAGAILFLPSVHELISGDLLHHIKFAVAPRVFEDVFNQLHFCEARYSGGDVSPLVWQPEEIRFWFTETLEHWYGQCVHGRRLYASQL